MKKIIRFVLLCLFMPVVRAEVHPAEVVRHILNQVAVPAYAHWHDESVMLDKRAVAFCANGQNVNALRQQWLKTHHAWLSLQSVMVMPDGSHPPGMQVQFWPDKRNLVARQVQTQLKDAKPITPDAFAVGSVVLRSLTTSEYILFDVAHDVSAAAEREKFCPLLLANTAFQAGFSAQLHQRWQGEFARRLLEVPNERYADVEDVMADLFSVDTASISLMLKKLGMPSGLPDGVSPQPYLAEAWRSGDSIPGLRVALQGSLAVWEGKGLRQLVQAKNAALAQEVDQAYANVKDLLNAVPDDLNLLLAKPDGMAQLKVLYQSLKQLEMLHATDVARTLNVQVGFNSTDGD
jgi:predicted lipoprotein